MSQKLKCFIASAFGYNDVDVIYNKVIRPTLNKLNIQPLRIDRVEHNEDIDDKIFKLLNDADFCIADLTYARPSVYYEAGYAFGSKKPVIYIVRHDHFKARSDDSFGNYRVHFDLQMKNIIPWNKPTIIFKNRLSKRIKFIIRGINKVSRKSLKQINEEKSFALLPKTKQILGVGNKANNLLRVKGFKKVKLKYGTSSIEQFSVYKYVSKKLIMINFNIIDKLDKSLRQDLSIWRPLATFEQEKTTSKIILFVVFVSLNKLSAVGMRNLLPSFTPISNGVYYSDGFGSSIYARKTLVHFIGGIKSILDFELRFKEIFDSQFLKISIKE